ncbi:MAG: hypothetical protein RI988_194, partial [Pseudomonadota bacterium]
SCTSHCQRDTANPIPCRVPGGCGYNWGTHCAICQHPTPDNTHACPTCQQQLRHHLNDIQKLIGLAHDHITGSSSKGTTRPAPASRPPLTVNALDPGLTEIEIDPDDPELQLTILEILEMWERVIRQDRGLIPYGIASEAAMDAAGARTDTWATTWINLNHTIAFHHGALDWAITAPNFDLPQYAHHLKLCRAALTRWEENRHNPAWKVPCPTLTTTGECARILRVDTSQDTVTCRSCGNTRSILNLLRVAGTEADVWVDIESAARLAGVTERTVRNWVQKKTVQRRRMYVRLMDVRAQATRLAG